MTSRKQEGIVSFSPTSVAVGPSQDDVEPISLDERRPWKTRPMSEKAQRTTNPIRRIVDPIVANIQNGSERGDGKDHISLAVRFKYSLVHSCSSHRALLTFMFSVFFTVG